MSDLQLQAREKFDFTIGEQISIFSDKAYRRFNDDMFEVVGNVIIIHGNEAIYGESASLNTKSGELQVEGNVRYITGEMTLYGSKLDFNTKNKKLNVESARIITSSYYVVGKRISRISEEVFLADEAEYTTCRDCPESWSVYGHKVRVTMGNYIHMTHALVKINGIVVMYLPYMVLPLKKGRQTGLLFPSFALSLSKGVTYQQPWFWAMESNKDVTLTPTSYGKRGMGGEFQYRHVFGDRKWFELNSMGVMDSIYLPNKQDDESSNTHYFRHFSEFEQHYQFGRSFLHHLKIADLRDHDMINDHSNYTGSRIKGSEVGVDGFLEYRNSLINLGAEGAFKNNALTQNPTGFDDSYVQVLPSGYMEVTPITLLHETIPGIQNLSLGARSTYTVFKQEKFDEDLYIRNAKRLTANPYAELYVINVGPMALKTTYQWEFQDYDFRDPEQESFTKYGSGLTTEISFEMDRIFGLAFEERIPLANVPAGKLEQIKRDKKKKAKENDGGNLIGNLDKFENSFTESYVVRKRNSYKHSQEFKLLHHYTTEQNTKGNSQFYDQIDDNTKQGVFDSQDVLRTKEHLVGTNETRTSMPVRNTIEIQWLNYLIRKEASAFDPYEDNRFLRQNFNYSKIAYFNLSQGLELNTQNEEFIDDLTRLHLTTGLNPKGWHLSFSDYYFYKTDDQILETNISRKFAFGNAGVGYSWNTIQKPSVKRLKLSGMLSPMDILSVGAEYDYDLYKGKSINSNYTLTYVPMNNCWKISFRYEIEETQNRFSVNFFINYSDNKFTSLTGESEDG